MVLLNCCFAHLWRNLIPKLEELDIAETAKEGKFRYVVLTPKGKEVFKRIAEIGELLGEPVNLTRDRKLDLIEF